MLTKNPSFDALADAARCLNDEDYALEKRDAFESRIASLTPREKQAERNRRSVAMDFFKADANRAAMLAELREMEATEATESDRGAIDYHAAGCTHDGAGFRIL